MPILWENRAWDEYLYWQSQDKKTVKKINTLLKDMLRNPCEGIEKPEPLRGDLSKFWSRRIDDVNRIVYYEKDETIFVVSCKGHYEEKKTVSF